MTSIYINRNQYRKNKENNKKNYHIILKFIEININLINLQLL